MARRKLAPTGIVLLAGALGVSLWLAISNAPRDHVAPVKREPDRLPPLDPARIPNPYPDLGITIDRYPRLDGSTSTQPLQMMVACRVFGMPTEWVHIEQTDTRLLSPSLYPGMEPLSRDDFAQRYQLGRRVETLVEPRGTPEAYVNLIEGRADLALVARSPSDDERALADRRGVELDVRPLAYDAFVFLLNARNPVAGLTLEQIRDVYSGRLMNWREVGGPDAPIRPYQRTRNSGSQELMQTLVMKGRAMLAAPDLLTGAIMSWPFLAVDKDVQGIGYSVFYYGEFMAPRTGVKPCEVDGVLPTSETIRSRRYPLIAEVFVAARQDLPRDHPARRLRDWLLGPAGQAVVAESGYVPVGAAPESPPR